MPYFCYVETTFVYNDDEFDKIPDGDDLQKRVEEDIRDRLEQYGIDITWEYEEDN